MTRARFLLCAAIAIAAGGAAWAPAGQRGAHRPRIVPPHERAYGLIEAIGDRQLGEFVARNAATPAIGANCPARPA